MNEAPILQTARLILRGPAMRPMLGYQFRPIASFSHSRTGRGYLELCKLTLDCRASLAMTFVWYSG